MESMVKYNSLFGGVYAGKKVFLTGHTGFKGSWLSQWLQLMGAKVYGYALAAPSTPNHLDLLKLDMQSIIGDVRDQPKLEKLMKDIQPDIVFHLAAQSLVRPSYADPVETFSTNVMGTLHVYEASRKVPSIKAIVNVTSDKCYENKEWVWGYRENDPMGGYDPYSASKGCSELLTASYRNSFFNLKEYGKSHAVLLASGRAGNVVGGGDWAVDRLIPDIVKAAARNESVTIRYPRATRPWQHVLEPLSGYLTLGWRLLEGKKEYAEGWNFGPEVSSNLAVGDVVNMAKTHWSAVNAIYGENPSAHEANLLMLDCSKAGKLMKWRPVWDINDTMEKTIGWYKSYYLDKKIETVGNINDYVARAAKMKAVWAA